ncbi:hypothetical protein H5410_055786 [Solanum commersonii]|uniref:Uncharacterized protein n=1 Tax=Solanum commersonii TaxID=4109 RepID=A0A9J5WKD5_SOLCO|nr:hypothetical protein H5410_055786 [Solanum commersonii]
MDQPCKRLHWAASRIACNSAYRIESCVNRLKIQDCMKGTISLGLFKDVDGCMSDPPKIVYF